MKLKYWIMALVVAAAVAAGGMAISQEELQGTKGWANGNTTTSTPVLLVACFSTASGSTTLTALNFMSVTSSETLPSCGSLHRLVINGIEE